MSYVGIPGLSAPKTIRKKTPGACERCRDKRIKCNGVQPCDQCSKKREDCLFTIPPSIGSDILAEKLDLILARMDRLEKSITRQYPTEPSGITTVKSRTPFQEAQSTWLAKLNPQTGCFEYYGRTSTFVVASSLGKRIQQLEERLDPAPLPKRRRTGDPIPFIGCRKETKSLDLDDLTGVSDYVLPPNVTFRQTRCLRTEVADRHVESFFNTIHFFLPIFDFTNFKLRYNGLRDAFEGGQYFTFSQSDHNKQQFLCLLYAVLALGALYEDGRKDSSSWASWYFAKAQEILGCQLDAVNLELVQAAMLMGAYAQHAIKPSLAYNLTGIATRLAFSSGLNTESTYTSPTFDAEEARRTWWLIYIQEVELSLDSGRPMTIQTVEMDVGYPENNRAMDGSVSASPSPIDFIRPLAEIAKVIRRILELVNNSTDVEGTISSTELPLVESHREELLQWRRSLPIHLQFSYDELGLDPTTKAAPYSWRARQLSSLRIHYNLAMIILFRNFLNKPPSSNYISSHYKQQEILYKNSCVEAACDMISHIHELFSLAPSLRRWSYYCFYCLQSTLVLLAKLTEEDTRISQNQDMSPSTGLNSTLCKDSKVQQDLLSLCKLSIIIFHQIELEAAKCCAQLVQKFLDRWENRQRKYKQRDKSGPSSYNDTRATSERSQLFEQARTMGTSVDIPQVEITDPVAGSDFGNFPCRTSIYAASPTSQLVNPLTEIETNVGEGETSPRASPSNSSLGDLQAELKLYSMWNNESNMNEYISSGMSPVHASGDFGASFGGQTEDLFQIQQDWTADGNSWLY